MPAALLKPCPGDGGACPVLVPSGYCPAHTQALEHARAQQRPTGVYGAHWRRFRQWVRHRMIALGIAPVCGASLPGGPSLASVSRCQAEGRLTHVGLHLHHQPPLQAHEQTNPRAVCDATRVGWLCTACHTAETNRERAAGLL